jgi:hypothetical protein
VQDGKFDNRPPHFSTKTHCCEICYQLEVRPLGVERASSNKANFAGAGNSQRLDVSENSVANPSLIHFCISLSSLRSMIQCTGKGGSMIPGASMTSHRLRRSHPRAACSSLRRRLRSLFMNRSNQANRFAGVSPILASTRFRIASASCKILLAETNFPCRSCGAVAQLRER